MAPATEVFHAADKHLKGNFRTGNLFPRDPVPSSDGACFEVDSEVSGRRRTPSPPFLSLASRSTIASMTSASQVTRGQQAVARPIWMPLLVLVLGTLTVTGCAHQVLMIPKVERIDVPRKFPVEAALLITPEARNAILRKHPSTTQGWIHVHEFPMGQALEDASLGTFSQVFNKVTVVRSLEEAKKRYKLYIEPLVEDFSYYNGYHWLWPAVYSRAKVRVVVGSGDMTIWDFALRCPRQREEASTWFQRFVWDSQGDAKIGESASKALVFCLREIAKKMTQDASIRQRIDGLTSVRNTP